MPVTPEDWGIRGCILEGLDHWGLHAGKASRNGSIKMPSYFLTSLFSKFPTVLQPFQYSACDPVSPVCSLRTSAFRVLGVPAPLFQPKLPEKCVFHTESIINLLYEPFCSNIEGGLSRGWGKGWLRWNQGSIGGMGNGSLALEITFFHLKKSKQFKLKNSFQTTSTTEL